MSTGAVLEVIDLEKSFGSTQVLRRASLRVEHASVLGFVGPNGAGKSTCVRCVLGLCHPDAGRILVDGIDALAQPVAARRRIGYLSGELSLYGHMRGGEVLAFGLSFHPEIDTGFRDWCLDRFRLPLDRRVRTYSAGQKQMLALTIALSPAVPLYVLDEPDKALDASMRHDLRVAIERRRDEGRSFLLSSHHIAELEDICSDIAFLLDGEILDEARLRRDHVLVANRVRATLDAPPDPARLPEGTRCERDGGAWVLVPPEGTDGRALLQAVLGLEPRSLSYGYTSLQEIYKALYVRRREDSSR